MSDSIDTLRPNENTDDGFKVTEDYPGLIVHDGRVHGAITPGHSRLGFFALIPNVASWGYSGAAELYPELPELISEVALSTFLGDLFEHRQDFARLLCVLADLQRWERSTWSNTPKKIGETVVYRKWYNDADNVSRLRAALSACLEELDSLEKQQPRKFRIADVRENCTTVELVNEPEASP